MRKNFKSVSLKRPHLQNLTFHSPRLSQQTVYDPNLYGPQIVPLMHKTANINGSFWLENQRAQNILTGAGHSPKLKVPSILPTAKIGEKLPELPMQPSSLSQ